MNGINYGTLFGNTGLFQNKDALKNNTKFTGSIKDVKSRTKIEREVNKDTVEIDGRSRDIPKVGYERPKQVKDKFVDDESYKKLDANGVQEGVELSDAAKKLLEELREKYQNMDIKVLSFSSDKEQEYYASRTDKEFSVLIDPKLLESMAADESVRAKYEEVLDSAGQTKERIKEELGDDYEAIENFTITIDMDGKVTYMAKLIEDFTERNKQNNKDSADRIEAEKEENKIKNPNQKGKYKKVEADSIEDLISRIKEELAPEKVKKE